MKFLQKTFALLFLTVLMQTAQAQYCGNSGPTICTAGSNLTAPGFSPSYDSLPCAVQGVYYDQTIQVKIPTSIVYSGQNATIVTLTIDTLSNLPCGLCWSTASTTNTFNGGSQFCIRVKGTTYDNVGQYKLHIIVSVAYTALGGFVHGTQNNVDAGTAGLNFWARVVAPNGTCALVDTNSSFVGQTASTVGAAPSNAVTASGSLTFCQGGSVTFTATQTGAQYQWYKGANAISGATSRTYTADSAGSYTVNVIANCQLVTSAAQVVVVNPLPTAPTVTATASVLCPSRTDTLDAGAGYTTYAWSNALGAARKAYPTAAGTYTVTVTNANTCSATGSVTITAGTATPTPTITAQGNTTFCAGGSVVLQSSTANNYSWTGGGTTRSITVTTSGSYIVTTNNGCGPASSTATVITVNPKPTASITPVGPIVHCNNLSQLLTASGGTTYQWLDNGSQIGGQTSGTYTAAATGNYSYIATTNGCSDTSNVVVVTITSTGLTPTITPTQTYVCPSGNVTLDAGAGYTTYLWSQGAATTRTISVSAAGTYSVTVGNGSCTGTTSINITSQAATPTPTITTAGSLSQCGSGSVTLTSSAASGNVWSNSATTQAITVNTSGTYTVTANGLCGAATSAPVTFTINPLPTPTVNNATICAGANATLTATGGTSYSWNQGGNSAAITVTPTVTTTYTVTATDANRCSATASGTVTVNNAPTVTAGPDTTICSGNSATLTATSNGTSFAWSNNANTASTSVTTAGTYTVTATLNGCTAVGSAIVTVTPSPTAAFTVSGHTLTATGGTTYQWFDNGSPIAGATSAVYTATVTGNYSVQATSNGCSNTSAAQTVVVSGINDISGILQTIISPNPTNGELTIAYGLNKDEELEITLTDITGRTISHLYAGNQNSGHYRVVTDMSTLSSGMYLINFRTPDGVISKKVIKE